MITGSDFVAKAEPNGYTLLFTAPGPLTVNQTLYSKLPFDPAKDFASVALFATAPIVLIVNPGVPANGVQELIALVKKAPGKLNFASAGNVRPITCPANCSRAWPTSISCTCRIAAQGRRKLLKELNEDYGECPNSVPTSVHTHQPGSPRDAFTVPGSKCGGAGSRRPHHLVLHHSRLEPRCHSSPCCCTVSV